ncbi:MAG: flavodoxin family protein [Nanobdellota archaeon]
MKVLVVWYSRTGITRKAGQAITKKLNADCEEIYDAVDRSGVSGSLKSGKDAIQKKTTSLKPLKKNPEDYDIVVIGTPVWAFTMCPAIRTYLKRFKGKIASAAFFCSMNSSGDKKTLQHMREISKITTPCAEYSCKSADVKNDRFNIDEFIRKIKACANR